MREAYVFGHSNVYDQDADNIIIIHVPYSIPSVGCYCGEYSLYCNFPGEIFHKGGFPMPSHEGIRL